MSRNETGCYRCGGPDHWADTCPLLVPAASEAEHKDRIRLYVDRWVEGHLRLEQKRVAISLENEMWYGREKCPRNLTYP
jgi:hypothetical protein